LSTTDDNELLDIGAAAQFLNVSETSLRRWTNAGLLPCMRVGRRRERRFRRGDLLAFMEQPGAARRSSGENRGWVDARGSGDEPVTTVHGNHLCGIYGSDSGFLSLAVPFLLEGLREGSICFFVGPARSQEKVRKNLEDLHPSLASDIKEGRLVLTLHRKSAKAEWKFLESHVRKAEKAGESSFRVVGDMIGIRAQVSAKELVRFEAGLDERLTRKYPISILCLYDAREFTGIELLNALKTHRDTFGFPLGRALG
jgi:transcriptional repressor of dcmA and dcmR